MNKFILIILLYFTTFSPQASIQAHCLDLIQTSPKQIKSLIYKDKNKYKFIYLFTSWCYECNETLDKLHSMQLNNKLSKKYNFYFISLDDNYKKLLQFSNNKTNNISKIFYFDKFDEIKRFLIDTNINYDNAVPYYCILNEDNKIVTEGYFELEELDKVITSD